MHRTVEGPLVPAKLGEVLRAEVEYLFRDEDGAVQRRRKNWTRPRNDEAVQEWVEDYVGRVADGYIPEGFTVAPVPFCARVLYRGAVVAEWTAT